MTSSTDSLRRSPARGWTTGTQPWARAIQDAYPHLHGILYVPATGDAPWPPHSPRTAAGALTNGRVLLSRRLADPAMLAVVESAAERLRFDVTVA